MNKEIKIINISGITLISSKLSVKYIASNAQVAGNKTPIFFKKDGSISVGNIIPESIIEGRKINWEIIVNFDVLFIKIPSRVPRLNEDTKNSERIKKYTKRLLGVFELKAIGEINKIIIETIKRCIKADKKLFIIGVQSGIFPTI